MTPGRKEKRLQKNGSLDGYAAEATPPQNFTSPSFLKGSAGSPVQSAMIQIQYLQRMDISSSLTRMSSSRFICPIHFCGTQKPEAYASGFFCPYNCFLSLRKRM